MSSAQEAYSTVDHRPETQTDEAKFWMVTPGAVCLPITSPSMAEPLQFKAGLEGNGVDCELTIHRLHPAGWQSSQGHTEADSKLALFVMPNTVSHTDALRALTETGRYKDRAISGWTERYHTHIVRNNPGTMNWTDSHPQVPVEQVGAVAKLLTASQAHENRGRAVSERRLRHRSISGLARVALQRLSMRVA